MLFKNDSYKPTVMWSIGFMLIMPALVLLFPNFSGEAIKLSPDWNKFFITSAFGLLTILSSAAILSRFAPHIELSNGALHTINCLSKKKLKTIFYKTIQMAEIQKAGENHQLILTTTDHQRVIINGFKEPSLQKILQMIAPYVAQTRQQPVQIDIPMQGDIGQRVVHVISLGIFLIGLSVYISNLQHAWHSSSEQMFLWLLVSIPLAILAAYAWIVGEKKNTPWIAASVSGVVLGVGFNLIFLESHRLWNEQHTAVAHYAFRLDEKEHQLQKWTPVQGNPLVFHDGYVLVHDVWKEGFNAKLEQGQTYTLAVQHSRLNDIAFPVSAFHQAKLPQSQTK